MANNHYEPKKTKKVPVWLIVLGVVTILVLVGITIYPQIENSIFPKPAYNIATLKTIRELRFIQVAGNVLDAHW